VYSANFIGTLKRLSVATIAMPFISVRDIQIYYEISGKGPRLLYISGTGADLRNKPDIFDSPLADHFEILAFDQRGLGQTGRPDIRYSMEDYANDAAGLLQALDWGRCHVMGISFGGMVAQEFALRHPECIDRLVLCCTSSGGAGADEPGRETGARRQLEARIDHDTYDRLPRLELPVFIAGGAYDGVAPPANLEAISRQIDQSKIQFFQGGHDFYDHDPLAYQRIDEFLQGKLDDR
jgi:3-oxoadipate enol-lactonase